MDASLDAVKAKVRALLAKTVANGCTEHEALAAAEKAFALMRAHQLTQADLNITSRHQPLGRTRRQPLDDLWGTVAYVCRCRCTLMRPEDGQLAFVFRGRDPWPEVAVWLQGVLTQAHGRALAGYRTSAEYRRRRTPRTRAAARRAFTVGFVHAVKSKLLDLVADWAEHRQALAEVDAAKASSPGTTRVLAPLGDGAPRRDAVRDRAAGEDAGQRTSVNWGLNGSKAGSLGQSPKRLTHGDA